MIVDLFAGGGGASEGIRLALGRDPDVAVNHSAEAIAMHLANHPRTRHFIEDVFDVNPRRVCGDEPVELLWMSPDCTHFSRAAGRKPRSKGIRSLAWTTIRWARLPKEKRPLVMFLENVLRQKSPAVQRAAVAVEINPRRPVEHRDRPEAAQWDQPRPADATHRGQGDRTRRDPDPEQGGTHRQRHTGAVPDRGGGQGGRAESAENQGEDPGHECQDRRRAVAAVDHQHQWAALGDHQAAHLPQNARLGGRHDPESAKISAIPAAGWSRSPPRGFGAGAVVAGKGGSPRLLPVRTRCGPGRP